MRTIGGEAASAYGGGVKLLIRVYYDDTDEGGVVYYGNYLKYFERARTELIEEAGFSVKEYQDQGVWFTVLHAELNYLSPAFYSVVLEVTANVEVVRRVRFRLFHEIRRHNTCEMLVTGSTTLACIDATMKPRPLPPALSHALSAQLNHSCEVP